MLTRKKKCFRINSKSVVISKLSNIPKNIGIVVYYLSERQWWEKSGFVKVRKSEFFEF